MAIDRFQNKDILTTSKVPVDSAQVYSLDDVTNLVNDGATFTKVELQPSDYDTFCKTEAHIYSADILVESLTGMIQYELNQGDDPIETNILLRPEMQVRQTSLDTGYYSIVYNFTKPLTSEMRVINVNADNTELELEFVNPNHILTELKSFIDNPIIDPNNQDNILQPNLVLNFGGNELALVTDISFQNNPRIGVQTGSIPFPTDSYGGLPTFFAPSEQESENNFWIEFYSTKQENAFNPPAVIYQTTGRFAKAKTTFDENGNPRYELIKIEGTEDVDYYYDEANNDAPEEKIYPISIPHHSQYFSGTPRSGTRWSSIPRSAKIRFYNPNYIESELKKVVVKLYKPLPDGLSGKQLMIENVIRDSYIERVLLYNIETPEEQPNFSPPNFKIDMGNYGKSQGTDLKSWNDLLDTNLSTSQQIIDKYISGSFGGVKLNLDYTRFNSFVKYSSAVERVNNLKYKLELIESFNKRVKTLESVSGSEALTNISQSISRRDAVVSGFDGWERWMYTESTGSLYTHYTSSASPLEPWPKQSTYPNVNYSVTSSQGIAHYNGLIDSASIHDALNDARLTKVVPASIVEDPLNKEYVLFVDMIGHHFDITWSYINALTSINEREEHPYDGMPNELLYDVAKSMGWKLTHGKDTSNLWEFGLGTDKFGNVPNSGSLPSKSHEDINNEVWRRIVNNIPYLLKTKGSARAVKALIATYGIPQTFLSIREYGGPVIEHDVRPYWEHDRFVYHLRMDKDNYITVPWDKVADINPVTYEINTNTPGNGSTITKVVKVVDGVFEIDEVKQPTLILDAGNTYKFDVSDSSNGSHPFRFQKASDNSTYTTGVTVTGTQGNANATVQIVVSNSTPALKYYCTNHSGMGGNITINVGGPNPIDVIELQLAQNLNRHTGVIRKGSDFAVAFESQYPNDFYSKKGNIHFYLSGSGGYKSASIAVPNLFDSNMGTLLIERETSGNDITKDNVYKLQYRRNRKDRIQVSKSASISINGSTESSYNAAWTGSGVVQFGNSFGTISGAPSLWGSTQPMSGSIQEIRYWAEPLKDIVIDEHTLSRESYHGNSVTSSYFDLKFRFIPDSNLKTITNPDSHLSQHPNQQITGSVNGSHLTASLFNFENDDLIGVTEEYYTKVPSAGANNILNNKVRTEANPLTGILNPENKMEKSQYDSAPVDSNVVGVYLAATRMYNEDIINHTGYFDIDDYIGNPDQRSGYTEQNEELDYIRRQVFKKYSSKNLINNTIDILAKYDMSVFEQIRQTMPARVDYNSGILIEPHILERPKAKSLTKVTQTRPMYDAHIPTMERPISASKHIFETEVTNSYSLSSEIEQYETEISNSYSLSAEELTVEGNPINTSKLFIIEAQKDDVEDVGNPQVKDMYAPSQYRYVIPVYKAGANVGYGLNWNTGSNGSWNYNPIATTVVENRTAQYGKITKLFYSSALSASLNLPNSSSLEPAQVGTDELPLAVENLRFLGCKMTSDSLTTNSPDTPDGKPVIEIFQADPNVLLYTSETAAEGNLDVDTATGLDILDVKDLVVDDDIYWKRLQEYRRELREFRRKIEKMIEIEDARAEEFDLRYKKELQLREAEMFRRKEFDIKNGSPF